MEVRSEKGQLSTLNGEMGELQFDAPCMQVYFRVVKHFSMMFSEFISSSIFSLLPLNVVQYGLPQ
jgi:hypothetical protein